MQTVKTFVTKDFLPIRVLEFQNEVWFVGVDIAKTLGYSFGDSAIESYCKDRKSILKKNLQIYTIPCSPDSQEIYIISKNDVLSLVLNSRLTKANKFYEWIEKEVIPTVISENIKQKNETEKKKFIETVSKPDFQHGLFDEIKAILLILKTAGKEEKDIAKVMDAYFAKITGFSALSFLRREEAILRREETMEKRMEILKKYRMERKNYLTEQRRGD